MSVRIIVDSTADLIPELKNKLKVVPMTVIFGEDEYVDGVTITNEQFYKKLENSDILPHTSQATPTAFDTVFKEVAQNGDEAVVITLASKLSGTYQSAVIAAEDYKDKIFVVDSKNAAIGSGVLAILALRLADDGKNAKEIADILCQAREKISLIAIVDTLEFLKRGGRISKTAAIAGGLLSIKPIISIEDGEIKIIGKARGLKQGNALLINEIERLGGIDSEMPVLLGYTGVSDEHLQSFIDDNIEFLNRSTNDINYTIVGSVIGTHAGPGAYAVAFFRR